MKPAKPLMSPCLMTGAGAGEKKGRPREEICATRLKSLCQASPPRFLSMLLLLDFHEHVGSKVEPFRDLFRESSHVCDIRRNRTPGSLTRAHIHL